MAGPLRFELRSYAFGEQDNTIIPQTYMAGAEGFEPSTHSSRVTVFKTAALSRSATPPYIKGLATSPFCILVRDTDFRQLCLLTITLCYL